MVWWDPIGVYGVPEALDEYDGYAGGVARKLREGAREPAIAQHLIDGEAHIGMAGDAERAAEKIVEWHDQVLRKLLT